MDLNYIKNILTQVQNGQLSVEDASSHMQSLPFSELGFATVDHHRAIRQGLPEVIFAPPKTPEQVVAIAEELLEHHANVLVTRISPRQASLLTERLKHVRYNQTARTASIEVNPLQRRPQRIVIVTAGTGDLPVAEEAAETLRMSGFSPLRIADVGVAGIHRLLAHKDTLQGAHAVIVVAGMEGALPSVIGGMVAGPVVAVPTSVGYGAHLGGLTPLMAMLSSCAAGITVVNIDNGFGAAMAVHRLFASPPRTPSEVDTENTSESVSHEPSAAPATPSVTGAETNRVQPGATSNTSAQPLEQQDFSDTGTAVIVEANVDDMTGELGGHLIAKLQEVGAWDAWLTPTTTKKGRPAWTISAMGSPAVAVALRRTILNESTSIGVRSYEVERTMLPRTLVTVDTRFGKVPVKVSEVPGSYPQVKPEFSICQRLGAQHGVPSRIVQQEALDSYRQMLRAGEPSSR